MVTAGVENTHRPATNLTLLTEQRLQAGYSIGNDALRFDNEFSDAEAIHFYCKNFAELGPACFH